MPVVQYSSEICLAWADCSKKMPSIQRVTVLGCSLRSASTAVVHIAIYRPGSAKPTKLFFDELTRLLEIVVTYRTQIVITGDFNVHVNDPDDCHARQLAELLESFDLLQSVSQPTHREGNTLDLVITRPDNQPLSCSVDPPKILSDHALIVCKFPSIPVAVRQVPSIDSTLEEDQPDGVQPCTGICVAEQHR